MEDELTKAQSLAKDFNFDNISFALKFTLFCNSTLVFVSTSALISFNELFKQLIKAYLEFYKDLVSPQWCASNILKLKF